MTIARPHQISGYLRRLGTYLVPVSICAMTGATYARSVGNWPETTAVGGLASIPFSVGPALLIVSTLPLDPKRTVVVASIASLAILLMWLLFANTTSDRAILAFMWGPPVGIPLAAIFVVAMRRRQAVELAPSPNGAAKPPTV